MRNTAEAGIDGGREGTGDGGGNGGAAAAGSGSGSGAAAQETTATAAECGMTAAAGAKRRRSPCSRRSGKKSRMTPDQRAMDRRQDADGGDGGAASGHL